MMAWTTEAVRTKQRELVLSDSMSEFMGQLAGSDASADNSLCSGAEGPPVTFVSDGNRLEIRHVCFAACRSSVRQ
jgi:hypothetical protein